MTDLATAASGSFEATLDPGLSGLVGYSDITFTGSGDLTGVTGDGLGESGTFTFSGSGPANALGTNPAKPTEVTVVVDWDSGETSTFELTVTATIAAGIPVCVITGDVTDGVGKGEVVEVTAGIPNAVFNPLDALTEEGVTDIAGSFINAAIVIV
ncbi:hypothetical protein ACFYUL_17860 [Streptomyces sp. NPDC004311]|uniref:hypothetical protein n=1 Tax=Streptomyces sp. NPDC004311 TaxID=3364698 RepID=UPI00367E406D